MKLYYQPGACSLAAHIVLREALLPIELVKVDRASKRTEDGREFSEVNPLGYVPALEFDNGQVLTEVPAIIQYVGDQAPTVGLVPGPISFERYRFLSWMNFVATELHKGFSPLFSGVPDAARSFFVEGLRSRYDFVEKHLAEHNYLLGKEFSAVDAYLFVVLRWSRHAELDLKEWPALSAYQERVQSRAHVRAALEAEGLS